MQPTSIGSLAIKAALSGNWPEAINLNLAILKKNSHDLEALLRLAKAYEESGQIKISIKQYRKVLKIDKFNPISKRNLLRLYSLKDNQLKKEKGLEKLDSNLFLEEPGKTKIVSLIKLGAINTLIKLKPAQEVKFSIGKHSISVRNQQNDYLGRFPDDLALRLIKLIRSGNQYLAVVKATGQKNLQIFIKETKRSKANTDISSFSITSEHYHPFLPIEILNEEN